MQRFLTVLFLAGALTSTSGIALAQQAQHEIPNATASADDSKANSPDVPDVYAITGKFDRVVILRFKYQADLLEGIERMVKQQNIRNAVILSAIGTVRNFQMHAAANRNFPVKNAVIKDPTAPADLIGMNGYVINGQVHAHVTFANPERAFGGHLERGTNVFAFAAITLGVLNEMDLSKLDDKTYR
jgi:predicted DNA-binding protein with PD1-like motif